MNGPSREAGRPGFREGACSTGGGSEGGMERGAILHVTPCLMSHIQTCVQNARTDNLKTEVT